MGPLWVQIATGDSGAHSYPFTVEAAESEVDEAAKYRDEAPLHLDCRCYIRPQRIEGT